MHTEPKFTVMAGLSEGLEIWGRASSNVMAQHNLPTPVEIGLNDLPKSDAPPPPQSLALTALIWYNNAIYLDARLPSP